MNSACRRRSAFPPAPPWARDLVSVGVTGTNGKTSTVRLVAAAIRAAGHPVLEVGTVGAFFDGVSWGSFDTHAGFLKMAREASARGCHHMVVEVTSEALSLGFATSWAFRVGVFTNLSHDHLERHGTPEHYLASKAQLFVHLPQGAVAVLNARDPASLLLREVVPPHARVLSYGAADRGETRLPEDLAADDVRVSWSGTRASARLHGAPLAWELSIASVGAIYVENALAASLAASALGIPIAEALAAMAQAEPVPGRFQIVSRDPAVVIDYAHTPDGLERTLATARQLTKGRLIVVFGAGGGRDPTKRRELGRVASSADLVVLTTDNPRDESPRDVARAIEAGLAPHTPRVTMLDRAAAIEHAITGASPHDVIVVAGKGHETTQEQGGRLHPFCDADSARDALARIRQPRGAP